MSSLYVSGRPGSDNKRRNNQKKSHNQRRFGNQKRTARSYRNSGTGRKKSKSAKSRRGFNRDRRDANRYSDKHHNKAKSADRQYTHRQDHHRHRHEKHDTATVAAATVATKHNDRTKSYAILRDQLFEILGGGVCSGCGFKDKRALGIASKYGDVPFDPADKSAATSSWARYVADAGLAVSELVVLCLNCHRIREPISRSKKTSAATVAHKKEGPVKKSHKTFPRQMSV